MDVRFNAYKAKFDMLDGITRDIFNSQKINSVNIFISLDDIYWHCRNSNVNREFQCCGNLAPKQLVSNVLNLMAHYREWAVRKDVNVKVFAYYTTNTTGFFNKSFIDDYRKHHGGKCSINDCDCFYVNICIKEAAEILKTITQYIDSAYVINTHKLEPAAFPYLCATELYKADWNFIVTRDIVEFQYAYHPKFSVIYPKGDETELITDVRLWHVIAEKEKIKESLCNRYPANFYPVALAIVGDKKRGIPKIKGISWRTVFKMMDDILESNQGINPISAISEFLKLCESKNINMEELATSIDVLGPSFNRAVLNDVAIENIKAQFIDIPDYQNLIDLNKRQDMFAECPINIRFLTRQNTTKAINPFKLNYS